jgi:hypothetical protein
VIAIVCLIPLSSFVHGLRRDLDHVAPYQFRFSLTNGQELMPGNDSAHGGLELGQKVSSLA